MDNNVRITVTLLVWEAELGMVASWYMYTLCVWDESWYTGGACKLSCIAKLSAIGEILTHTSWTSTTVDSYDCTLQACTCTPFCDRTYTGLFDLKRTFLDCTWLSWYMYVALLSFFPLPDSTMAAKWLATQSQQLSTGVCGIISTCVLCLWVHRVVPEMHTNTVLLRLLPCIGGCGISTPRSCDLM